MQALRIEVVVLLAALAASSAGAEELAVIVHAGRLAPLAPADLARIYLRQRRYWGNGERIIPVNRDSGSEERRLFDRSLFGAGRDRLVVYWNQQYFKGVLPPATLASDEAVRRFVAGEPRAIGYVRPNAVDASVRVLLRLDAR